MEDIRFGDGLYRLSASVRDILFEGMWPTPHGVTMNSYLVKGKRSALIDGVCAWDGVPETLFARFDALGLNPEDIDYVVINHAEPDHSGWLEAFRKIRPDFEIVASKRAVPILEAFFGTGQRIRAVGTGDSLDLGGGRVLEFYDIPNVHWPETMATFDRSSGTLFPCDAFGSFGDVLLWPFDDQVPEDARKLLDRETLRYYSNIVGTFSRPVQQALAALSPLPIRIIAPGHGLVWRSEPERILKRYADLASWSEGPALPKITLLWGSMYGMTEKAVSSAVEGAEARGVPVSVFRLPQTHISDVLAAVWESTGVILGMPTYEYGLFPPMAAALEEIGKKKARNRLAFRFGSYGWSGGAEKEMLDIADRLRMGWEFLPSAEFRGRPGEPDLDRVREGAAELALRVLARCAAQRKDAEPVTV